MGYRRIRRKGKQFAAVIAVLVLLIFGLYNFQFKNNGGQITTQEQTKNTVSDAADTKVDDFDYSEIPKWDDRNACVEVNNNKPYFTKEQRSATKSYEFYSGLDKLGRCTMAEACIGKDLVPTKPRGEIGMVRPTGWHTVKYKGIDGNYLYNRCHLIGYQLTGENANTKNLITGTRYLNIEGMLPFEDKVADYLHQNSKSHVLYRVTPVFKGNELLARGVLIEGYSVEDKGRGVCFCVFCYNVQPGVTIDYSDGSSNGPEYTGNNSNKDKNADSSKKKIKKDIEDYLKNGNIDEKDILKGLSKLKKFEKYLK